MQAVITLNGELQPDIKIIYLRDYSSIAAWATFIYDYSPMGYIAGVCEVYAL